jgi:hypothetical protein
MSLISLIVVLTAVLAVGFATNTSALAQQRYYRGYYQGRYYPEHRSWWERRREREEMWRIRQLDRENQLRYRAFGAQRVVGYTDRFGRFHAVGFYDRFGRFHRY